MEAKSAVRYSYGRINSALVAEFEIQLSSFDHPVTMDAVFVIENGTPAAVGLSLLCQYVYASVTSVCFIEADVCLYMRIYACASYLNCRLWVWAYVCIRVGMYIRLSYGSYHTNLVTYQMLNFKFFILVIFLLNIFSFLKLKWTEIFVRGIVLENLLQYLLGRFLRTNYVLKFKTLLIIA